MKREAITNEALLSKLEETEKEIMLSRATRRCLLRRGEFLEAIAAQVPCASLIFTQVYDTLYANLWETVPGFTSEAAPQLLARLEWLTDQLGVDPTSEDAPEESIRRYRFTCPEAGAIRNFEFVLWAKLDSASETCQRIQTGTVKHEKLVWHKETVEVPTYAFKC